MISGRSTTSFAGTAAALCLVVLALMAQQARAQCVSDADCGGPDQAGLCQGGVCQCGAGYDGDSPVDPAACTLTCTPPPVPDSVAFLVEPNVTMAAAAGNLVLNIEMDPFAKQVPTTVAFLHPSDGTRCEMMPALLGSGAWSQAVDDAAGGCYQDLVYSRGFAAEVGQACWQTLPGTVETGAQYAVAFNQYATQVEVVQSGLAPFGQAASKKRDETTITREFRRNYTISVATSFTPSTAPFQIIAGGAVLYRLVEINYDILNRRVIATVQTQTPATAKLANIAVALANSSGLAAIIAGPTTGACDAGSPAGKCDQFHTVTFADEPCAVADAELVLTGVFQCADGSAAGTCGFTDLPADDTYTMPNLLLTYDACPRVIAYGVDTSASFLRLHDDAARTTPISAPALQESTLYGLLSVEPTPGAVFQSVTLAALNVVRQDSPSDVDLGDQLGAAFVTLISPATSGDPANPTWSFDLLVDPAFFALTESYYLEATVDLVFANTGALTKRLVLPLAQLRGSALLATHRSRQARAATELVEVTGRDDGDLPTGQQGVACDPFRTQAVERTGENELEENQGSNAAAIAGIAAGVAGLLVAAAIIVVVVVRRRRRKQEECDGGAEPFRTLPEPEQSALDIL